MDFASLAVLLFLVLVLGAVARFVWRRPTMLDEPPPSDAKASPAPRDAHAPPPSLLLEARASAARSEALFAHEPRVAKAAQEDATHEVGADFYAEVVGLLEAELERAPQRDDLRLKLLEVYAATERSEAFVKLAAIHRDALPDGSADPAWASVAEMGRRLAPNDPLFAREAGTADEPLRVVEIRRSRRYYENVDPEALKRLAGELNQAWQAVRQDVGFWKKLRELAADFIGTPPRLMHAKKLSSFVGGAQILVRNESQRPESDAAVIAALGQALLAQSLGSSRVVASPADEGHALTVVRVAQQLGLTAELVVTQGEEALRTAELAKLREAGAQVEIVEGRSGGNEGQRIALARALEHGNSALFMSPLAAGPFPYPMIVRELQGLTGLELKSQVQTAIDRLPDAILVSASDGMPAIGILQAFLGSTHVELFCVEAGTGGGSRRHRLGREHHWLRASGRVHYSSVPAEVARFAAQHCMPDGAPSVLQLAGGELLVETFTTARKFTPQQVVVVVLPSESLALPVI
ncbi:MAG: Tryptophan synthase beta chain [Panacagrimonas sp.]|jgi:tryptophan synthase beta subunit|nr:pyridoxal-phosphate dependent enzyme [Panacagrimonas sp.]MCC2658943.1 Tryptophan synthase beta chain [Panacagrimonas sp.]